MSRSLPASSQYDSADILICPNDEAFGSLWNTILISRSNQDNHYPGPQVFTSEAQHCIVGSLDNLDTSRSELMAITRSE